MGQKKRRLQEMQQRHPFCCFCAGSKPTETIEHAPPKIFFKDKHRLKGLEFPACARCNNGSGQLDQVASFVAYTMGVIFEGDYEYWMRLAVAVRNNNPDVFEMIRARESVPVDVLSGNESLEMYKVPMSGGLFRDYLNPWAAKQIFALWFHHTGEILNPNSRVMIKWLSNWTVLEKGLPEGVSELLEEEGYLSQGKQESSEQYYYRFSLNVSEGIGLFVVGAHQLSGFVGCVYRSGLDGSGRRVEDVFSSTFATNAELGIHAVN